MQNFDTNENIEHIIVPFNIIVGFYCIKFDTSNVNNKQLLTLTRGLELVRRQEEVRSSKDQLETDSVNREEKGWPEIELTGKEGLRCGTVEEASLCPMLPPGAASNT